MKSIQQKRKEKEKPFKISVYYQVFFDNILQIAASCFNFKEDLDIDNPQEIPLAMKDGVAYEGDKNYSPGERYEKFTKEECLEYG